MVEALRLVARAEVDDLAQLWCDGWRVGHEEIVPPSLIQYRDVASFRARLLNSLPDCYVMGPAQKLQGFVRLKGAELDQFYVDPDQIGQGVAPRLMAAAEDVMRERGVRDAYLIASVGNARAVRFYEKYGWRNCGVRSAGVETADGPFVMDVIRFEKSLADGNRPLHAR